MTHNMRHGIISQNSHMDIEHGSRLKLNTVKFVKYYYKYVINNII